MTPSPVTNKLAIGTALVAMVLATSGARGQVSPRVSAQAEADQREQARLHFTRGVDFIQAQRWGDALVELEAARAIRPTASVMFNLGLAHRALGHDHAAIEAFDAYLYTSASSANPELRSRVQQYLSELHNAIGQLEIRVQPANATLRIDDVPVTHDHGNVTVDHGRHLVVLSADGFAPALRTVEVAPGTTAVIEARLVAIASSASLRVEANVREALIRVDNRDVGYGMIDESVSAGHHVVEVRAPGRITFRREYDAAVGEHHEVRAVLQSQPTDVFASPLFWGGAAVVVAGALVAGGVVLFSNTEGPYRGSWGVVTDAIRTPGH